MATFGIERRRPYGEGSDQELEPFKPLQKTRAESYEVEVPNTDWVLSLTAPTHVATSRASFTTYEPWQSMVRFGKTGTHAVVGIGTASFEALLKPGSDEITKMSVREVLHVPGLMSNIFSVTRLITRGFSVSLEKTYAIITKVNTNTCLYATWYEGLYRLALPGPSIRPSKLCEGENHVLAFDWPMAERHAWESNEARKRQTDEEQLRETDTATKKRASASPELNPAITNQPNVFLCVTKIIDAQLRACAEQKNKVPIFQTTEGVDRVTEVGVVLLVVIVGLPQRQGRKWKQAQLVQEGGVSWCDL